MNQLIPCLPGSKLLSKVLFIGYLLEIKSLVSCPDNIFRELYLATLYKFAEYCQAMPYSQTEFSDSYGFLCRQLQLTIAVLKLRRGILLPKNAGAETIAAEEAQWTFALFSAALLTDLYSIQLNREIKIYKADGTIVKEWTFLSGPLNESDHYYQMRFVENKPTKKINIFMGAFIGKVISNMQASWLSENKFLFSQWWGAILQADLPSNDIKALISKAANKAGILLCNEKYKVEENTDLSKIICEQTNSFVLDDITLKGWS
jgi:hypothetical protein